jgi:hypothetical protein
MTLPLQDLARLANEAARASGSDVDVVGVMRSEGEGDYAEVILTIRHCTPAPCQIVIGFDRGAPETQVRERLAEKIADHLRAHSSANP